MKIMSAVKRKAVMLAGAQQRRRQTALGQAVFEFLMNSKRRKHDNYNDGGKQRLDKQFLNF